jgi:hypothetical protein
MGNKIDIEEIKLLIPDYITGSLSEEDNKKVKSAIEDSIELNELYVDMKNAFELADAAEFDEPAPQYWNNLLPRVHNKIEERNIHVHDKNPLSYIWKILLPAAAVILIFILFRVTYNPEPQIAKKEYKIIEQEKSEPKVTEENKIEPIQKKRHDYTDVKDTRRENKTFHRKTNIEQDEINKINNIAESSIQFDEAIESTTFASLTIEELTIFGAGTPGMLDEDINDELENLPDSKREAFLEELKNNL